jgi:cytochrome P450
MPALFQSLQMQHDPLAFLKRGQNRFGDIFTIKVLTAGKVVVLAHHDMFEKVFTGDENTFLGGAGQEMIEPMVGPRSIFLSDVADHTWKRRIMLPPFHRTAIQRYTEQIQKIAETQAADWPTGRPIRLRERTQAIAMEVILQIIFGVEDPERIRVMRQRLVSMREPLNAIIMVPLLRRDLGPFSPWRVFSRRRAAVDEIVYQEIRNRRQDPDLEQKFDFLSLLIKARDEDGRQMTDSEVRDQLMSMVFAGYETTAIGLAWALELLARHPDVVDKLRASLDAGDQQYMSAVIDETLRLYPPLFHVARRVGKPVEINGHQIPEDAWLMIAIILVHRREDLYEDPGAFRPERFLDERPPRYGYVPFAAGSRRCLGMHLAKLEMAVVLEHLVRTMDISPGRRKPDQMKLFHITVVPRHGATVVFKPREAPDRATVAS